MAAKDSPTRGVFITLEGIEGAGKSSCIPLMKKYLSRHQSQLVVTREPGGTDLAEAIRDLVLGISHRDTVETPTSETEALLMFAARAQHLGRIIRPALERGDWVICDRFTDATIAYQGGARGLGVDKILTLANWVHADLWPDLTLFFDVSVATGSERASRRGPRDRIERERQDFFKDVRNAYLELASRFPQRIRRIDAERSIASVGKQVEIELERFIAEREAQ
ncbi:MAG: dTMP kinase [Gammaproteobacteria bacterium]|nr:dTMP kinase [Gammaproteobacteria bacterium]